MQEYTPQGRAKTCPWIALRGKEWKALSEIRDSQIATTDIMHDMVNIMQGIFDSQKERVEIERERLELEKSLSRTIN